MSESICEKVGDWPPLKCRQDEEEDEKSITAVAVDDMPPNSKSKIANSSGSSGGRGGRHSHTQLRLWLTAPGPVDT